MEKCGKLFGAGELTMLFLASVMGCRTVRTAGATKLRACSACAGDYEDPDRTAGEELDGGRMDDEGGTEGEEADTKR